MRAFAEFSRTNQFTVRRTGAKLGLQPPSEFSDGALVGGLQLRVDAPDQPARECHLPGRHAAARATCSRPDGTPTGTGTLGASVGEVFNDEFFLDPPTGVKTTAACR